MSAPGNDLYARVHRNKVPKHVRGGLSRTRNTQRNTILDDEIKLQSTLNKSFTVRVFCIGRLLRGGDWYYFCMANLRVAYQGQARQFVSSTINILIVSSNVKQFP